MPEPLPPAADLLLAARTYLEQELLPKLAGRERFKTRVVINVLAQVQRELELGPALEEAESARLRDLLADALDGLSAQNAELARRIRSGEIGWEDEALIEHLRQTLIGALEIDNPKWLKD
ncbi:MAG: DUF6285 domain-containing protein [SAR324 cluster bacterium]|nr:DUF6285 domain-containing protein [SAR324 cluster bacterium]